MSNISKNKTVRVTVQPEVSKELSNATKLRDLMRKDLRSVQDKKSGVVKVEKF